jgi:hypothetical protein
MTAEAAATWTAAQWNTHVRDNMLQTMPAKATAAGRIYCSTGLFAIAERVPSAHVVATSQSTSSSAYTDLGTGPTVTVTTGSKALVFFSARVEHDTASAFSGVSVGVSGGTTVSAADAWAITLDGIAANSGNRAGGIHLFTTLNAGSNTFTMRYRTTSGNVTVADRELVVLPL